MSASAASGDWESATRLPSFARCVVAMIPRALPLSLFAFSHLFDEPTHELLTNGFRSEATPLCIVCRDLLDLAIRTMVDNNANCREFFKF